MDRGTYTQHNGKPAVRFERTFGHPVERVWAAISEPKELAHWFPSNVELEPRTGGKITFSGDPNIETTTGTILTYDPPRRLSYTWYGDELHIELEPIGPDRCRFVMINTLDASDTAARNAAGWTVCIAELDKHLDGVQSDGPHGSSAEPWQPIYKEYVAAGMPHGASIPKG